MSEKNNSNINPSREKRGFDWGPPANNTADSLKEWLLYVIILVVLGVGVWVLLDINGERSSQNKAAQPAVSRTAIETDTNNVASAEAQPLQTDSVKFFVQLGAFADEPSAREIFDLLVADGFSPTLAEPDQQYEIYRIFVGPYDNEKEAEDKARKLNELDFQCFVIEAP